MRIVKPVLRVIALDSAIALLGPAIHVAVNREVSFAALSQVFLFSLIYANVIGGIAQLSMDRLWHSCSMRPAMIRFAVLGFALVAAAVVGCFIGTWLVVLCNLVPAAAYWDMFSGAIRMCIIITLCAGGSISMYEALRGRIQETELQLRTKELERERALKLATEARLSSLESRIHPHFLFNALNSISSLIVEDPERAERLIERMAELLRFSLDSHHHGLVPLEREMRIVVDYLEIEKSRFGDRLRYAVEIPPGMETAEIPPLSVQTLVENSVKYAVAPNRAGGDIRISAHRENGDLRLEVSDTGPGFALESVPSGHGIDNLQARLNALFGGTSGLSVAKYDGSSVVTVSVPYGG